MLLDPIRHANNPDFKGVIFRKTTPDIRNPGGLWDESLKLYPHLGAVPIAYRLTWKFPRGMIVKMAHLEHEKTKYNWQGSQLSFAGFEELDHFSESQFFYMLSRIRSGRSGVQGYVRANVNPNADSWVANFIQWWWDPETGYAIPERAGVLRWFVRQGDTIIWADSREELTARYGSDCFPMSVTFIPSSVYDNKILLDNDPSYLAKLKSMNRVDMERLLRGNWKIRPSAGLYFRSEFFEVVETLPANRVTVRFWDLAGTQKTENNDPSFTAGVKLSRDHAGTFYVEHVTRFQKSPGAVEEMVKHIASSDGPLVQIGQWQDPGQAGKSQAQYYIKQMAGYSMKALPAQKDKVTMASPVSAQAEIGNIKILRGQWNKDFLEELENFPDGRKNDQVDALSGAFKVLTDDVVGKWTEEMAASDGTIVNPTTDEDGFNG